MNYVHKSVLLHESVDALQIKPNGVYVDGTLGGGGHSEQIAMRLRGGKLICIDQDERAIERASRRLETYMDRITIVHGNFRELGEILDRLQVQRVDGMLFDLGVSSPHRVAILAWANSWKERPMMMPGSINTVFTTH